MTVATIHKSTLMSVVKCCLVSDVYLSRFYLILNTYFVGNLHPKQNNGLGNEAYSGIIINR